MDKKNDCNNFKCKNERESKEINKQGDLTPIEFPRISPDFLYSNADADGRIIMLEGEIDHEMSYKFVRAIYLMQDRSPSMPIFIVIDSGGGNLMATLAMYDIIKSCSCPIITFGKGEVMSAAVLLLAAGDLNNRFIYPNTSVMIHGGSYGAQGKEMDVDSQVKHSRLICRKFYKLLAQNTKIKFDVIKKMTASGRDFYYGSKQAVKLGIADNIIRFKKK